MNLLNDDWVAIRDFPSEKISKTSSENQKTSTDDICVSWNKEDKIMSISYIQINKDVSNFKHEASFHVNTISAIDLQLRDVIPNLTVLMPKLLMDYTGFWKYLSTPELPSDKEVIQNFTQYFSEIEDEIGEKMFLEMYFQLEEKDENNYLDNLSELNRVSLLDDLHKAKELLDEVSNLRTNSMELVEVLSIYELENEAQTRVDIAEAILNNFEREPFLELREFATEKLKNLEKLMHETNDDPELLVELSHKCFKCKKDVTKNELCLIDLQINYFEKCLNYVTSSCDYMDNDKMIYGNDFKHSRGFRQLQDKKIEFHNLTIQLLQLKKKKLILEREDIQAGLCELTDNIDLTKQLEKCQHSFYKIQMEIYKNILEAISEKEKLLQLQRKQFPDEPPIEDQVDDKQPSFHYYTDNMNDAGNSEEDENDKFYDCDDGENFESNHTSYDSIGQTTKEFNRQMSDNNNDQNNNTDEKANSVDGSDQLQDTPNEQSIGKTSTSFFVKTMSNKPTVNKWESRRVLAIQESMNASKRREMLNSMNRLYRKLHG